MEYDEVEESQEQVAPEPTKRRRKPKSQTTKSINIEKIIGSDLKWLNGAACQSKSSTQAENFVQCLEACFVTQCIHLPTYNKAIGESTNILDLLMIDDSDVN
jgi:hypothetical protein